LEKKIEYGKEKIKTLTKKTKIKEKKIGKLVLKSKNKAAIKKVSDFNLDNMFSNINENKKRNYFEKPGGLRYIEKIKRFAFTLHYYSPRAYCKLTCI